MSTPAAAATVEPDSAVEPDDRLRLRVKPDAGTGWVDGAWWPRTTDLAAEAPALVEALSDRLGSVETVTYHLGSWQPAAHRLTVGRARVRLAGYRWQNRHTIDLIGPARRLTLLVVPPQTDPEKADRALAASLDQVRPADELLG